MSGYFNHSPLESHTLSQQQPRPLKTQSTTVNMPHLTKNIPPISTKIYPPSQGSRLIGRIANTSVKGSPLGDQASRSQGQSRRTV